MLVAESRPALSIEEFLEQEERKELLRFSTAGSVDDGKSTLIGRLLYDAQGIYEDQLASIKNSKLNRSSGPIDFSLLTDGLRAEREQGITIDVAYRYFATPKRKFIIADTPGHEQYTRNMATGASTAALAVVLVDARNGVLPQTRRHAAISSLLGIPRVVVAVNKMDLVGYSREVFEKIQADFLSFAQQLAFEEVTAIPMSALEGDNVARRTQAMPWYEGPCLLEYLENVPVRRDEARRPWRFPVQYVIRPDQDFRGYAGQIASGSVRKGDRVMVLPSGKTSRVARITTFDGDLACAYAPMSVTLVLEDELDVSRGDMLVHPHQPPHSVRQLEAHMVWMADQPLAAGRNLLLKHATQQTSARITSIESRLDILSMQPRPASSLGLNDIGVVRIEASRALHFDPYRENRATGSFILIDPLSNATVGAGMILSALERRTQKPHRVSASERMARNGHRAALLALSRETLAMRLERKLFEHGCHVIALSRAEDAPALLRAGMLVIVSNTDRPDALDLDREPLPEDEEAAADALMGYLEQQGVLLSGRFSSGGGI